MKNKILILAIAAILFYGCDKEKVENEILQEEKPTATKKEKISGYVEKGPFVQGSNLTANELENDLTQTGKTFTTNLKNSEGYFEIKNLNLKSPFLQLAVDGFYFDELKGELSKSKVTLYALANVKTKNSVNVNLLTHVQKDRIEKLMEQKKTFAESYKQSILEIGKSFYFTEAQLKNIDFANVKITGNNDASLMLLAVSSIFLEGKTEAQLTEFLADYKNDLADNGKIDNAEINNKIKQSSFNLHQWDSNHKRPIDMITKNIVDYYKKKLKKDITIGDFGKYIDHNKNGDLADYENLKPNLNFQGINIANGHKTITTPQILENIQGNGKKNYTIKAIELTGNNSSFAKIKGTKPNFSLDILKNGNFIAKIILEHPKYADIEKNLNIRVGLENLTFQKLRNTNGKNVFSTQEILAQIQGQKAGYQIKNITISDSDKAEILGNKPNFSLKIKKAGTFTATIILEKTGFLDAKIENCEFEIGKPNLSFQKLTITNGKNSFSTQEILAQIQGEKAGYQIKNITISDLDKAEILGNKPNFSITIKKAGTFTATIILEKTGFLDAKIENCEFEIAKPNLSFQKLTIANGKNVFSTQEILAQIQGSKAGYQIKNITISDLDKAEVQGTKPNFSIKIKEFGTFKAMIILEKSGFLDAKIENCEFEIGKPNLSFQKLRNTNGKNGKGYEYFFNLLSTQEILAQIQGQKDGYQIKNITISDSDKAEVQGTKPNFSIKIKKAGNFTATIILEKNGFSDVILNNCQFDIRNHHEFTLTLEKLTKRHSGHGDATITTNEILAQARALTGLKYITIKNIIISDGDRDKAEVEGNKPNLKIKIKQAGTFTATIILERPLFITEEVNWEFEIVN